MPIHRKSLTGADGFYHRLVQAGYQYNKEDGKYVLYRYDRDHERPWREVHIFDTYADLERTAKLLIDNDGA